MRITLFAAGLRRDANPFASLALGLKEAGHQPRLAVPGHELERLESLPLDVRPLAGYAGELASSARGRKWLALDAKGYKEALAWLSHDCRHDMRQHLIAACEDSDVLLFHFGYAYEAAILSEKLRKPILFLCPDPPVPGISGWGARLTGPHARRFKADMNEWRALWGLAPCRRDFYQTLERQRIPVLHAYSPQLAPLSGAPAGRHRQTGAIRPSRHRAVRGDDGAEPDWRRWLEDGAERPLVYFGYDRLPAPDANAVLSMVGALAKQLGIRAIVETGGLPNAAVSPDAQEAVFAAPSFDCRALFPYCACAVHHGGAEMTHTAAEAGIPSVIVSAFAVEAGWGERLEALGIGRHLPHGELTGERLADAIGDMLREPARQRAQRLGQRIRSENGLQGALAWLERELTAAAVYRSE